MIDAHHHCWQRTQPFNYQWLDQPALTRINRDYLPNDLQPHLCAFHVTGTVLVQTQHDLRENDWALDLARQYPFILGIVGWVDLSSPACEEQLLAARANPRFVGVRHVVQDEPDDDFIIRPAILDGLRVLQKHRVPYDLLFYEKHLHHAVTVARAVPDLQLVLDHLSKPAIRAGGIAEWRRELQAAARCENLVAKLSGLVTEADHRHWTVDDLRPYFETALECFGPQRLVFGSDWPVCELAAEYEQVFDAARELTATLSADEQAAIFGENARRIYNLPVDSPSR